MRFHERLVVEVGDYSVLDIATNIEHLKRETFQPIAMYTMERPKLKTVENPQQRTLQVSKRSGGSSSKG